MAWTDTRHEIPDKRRGFDEPGFLSARQTAENSWNEVPTTANHQIRQLAFEVLRERQSSPDQTLKDCAFFLVHAASPRHAAK